MALPRVIAYVLAALVVIEMVAVGVMAVAADQPMTRFVVGSVFSLFPVVLGVIVARRRPTNWVGPLLVLIAPMAMGLAVDDLSDALFLPKAARGLLRNFYVGISPGMWMWLFVPPALLILVFPDGRPPGGNWRWIGYCLVIVPLLFLLPAAADPTPFQPPFAEVPHLIRFPEPWNELVGIVGVALLPIFLGLLVASAASIVVRYRRAVGVVRTQLKWFMLGATFLPATLLLGWAGFLFLHSPELVIVGFALTYLALPLATAIAVLRYDLYDVDRAISTAVTYGLITAALLAVFTLASFVVGLMAGQASPIAAAAATAICAAILAPLRTRLQRWVDRQPPAAGRAGSYRWPPRPYLLRSRSARAA